MSYSYYLVCRECRAAVSLYDANGNMLATPDTLDQFRAIPSHLDSHALFLCGWDETWDDADYIISGGHVSDKRHPSAIKIINALDRFVPPVLTPEQIDWLKQEAVKQSIHVLGEVAELRATIDSSPFYSEQETSEQAAARQEIASKQLLALFEFIP